MVFNSNRSLKGIKMHTTKALNAHTELEMCTKMPLLLAILLLGAISED